MATYRDLIYLCLDELKILSDDSIFTEEHVLFLLSKYRGMLLKQQYKDVKKEIPESNFQTICLEVEEVPAIAGEPCEGGTYLKSKNKIPSLMNISSPRIYAYDYFQGTITYVSRERMRYVGYNRWLPNIIYATIGPDDYLYMKSFNPQYLYMKDIKLTGIFENPEKAAEASLTCEGNDICDPLDLEFPLEEALLPQLVTSVLKELSGAKYTPEDMTNNAKDDVSDMNSFIRRNMKSDFLKRIDE